MKRQMALLFCMIGIGCADQGGTGGRPLASRAQCGAGFVSASPLAEEAPIDPFEHGGKIQLDGIGNGSGTSAALAVGEDRVFATGVEFSVTVRTDCRNPGAIARAAPAEAFEGSGLRSFSWKVPRPVTLMELTAMAESDECVAGLADEVRAETSGAPSDDPHVAASGHLKAIEWSAALNELGSWNPSQPVTIAIIDTGLELQHEDLRDVLWKNSGEIPGNGIDDDRNGFVDDVHGYNFGMGHGNPQASSSVPGYYHGTHVAGLAAAQGGNGRGTSGVIPQGARLMALNVFADRYTNSSRTANAIRYAADNGAEVINLSLGGVGRSATYESAIAYAIRRGAVVVAAAGNEGRELGEKYFLSPGGYGRQFAGMMAVGSINASNLTMSSFSNFSPSLVEIAAPGADAPGRGVLSTYPGRTPYSRLSGTSMATPVVAGAAALAISWLRAQGRAVTPALVEQWLVSTAQRRQDLVRKVRDGRVLNLRHLAAGLITGVVSAGFCD